VDAHPKHAIAHGAAAVGADTTGIGAAAIAATAVDPLTPPHAGQAGLADASAPVLPLAVGAAAPALAASAGDRFSWLHWGRGSSASRLADDGDGDPGQDPPEPSDDESPTNPRQHRLPLVMIGVLVLVAALVGGGTAAYRAMSASTPTTGHQVRPPASHGSSSTPGNLLIAPSTPTAPTTVAPTTVAPTTAPPANVAPTTVAPTTAPPTTAPPTTAPPTTAPPTTVAPTTAAPGSQAATP
ncbi:MAG: hypothetical protein ACLPXZ_20390, partial [Mycobacterium sp.]